MRVVWSQLCVFSEEKFSSRRKKNFPQIEIFLWLFSRLFCALAKIFSDGKQNKKQSKSSLRSWLNWREVLKINFVIFSLQFKTRKIYIIIFFFRRKKENSKIPTFSVRERTWRKWEAKSVCCVRVAKEKIWENVFLFLFKKNCTIGIVNETFELREIVDEVKIRKKLPISYNDSTILEIAIEQYLKSKWKVKNPSEENWAEISRKFPKFPNVLFNFYLQQ